MKNIKSIILILFVWCLSYFLLTKYVIQGGIVLGLSMSPTLKDSHHFFIKKYEYYFHKPICGDVVIFIDPSIKNKEYCIKRVIGVEGDSIHIIGGDVYINQKKLSEPYLQSDIKTYPTLFDKNPTNELNVICGKNEYFLMGDNRVDSVDSRYFGVVSIKNITGHVTY